MSDETWGRPLSLRTELRRKHPGACYAIDHGRSPTKAIRMNCIECMGGSTKLPAECNDYDCFLWPYRVRKPDLERRPKDAVPTVEEYDELRAKWWRTRGIDPDTAAARLAANLGGDDGADD